MSRRISSAATGSVFSEAPDDLFGEIEEDTTAGNSLLDGFESSDEDPSPERIAAVTQPTTIESEREEECERKATTKADIETEAATDIDAKSVQAAEAADAPLTLAESAEPAAPVAGVTAPAAATSTVEEKQEVSAEEADVPLTLAERLIALYSVHNPEKLADVDRTVAKYASKEDKLLKKLAKKYGADAVAAMDAVALAARSTSSAAPIAEVFDAPPPPPSAAEADVKAEGAVKVRAPRASSSDAYDASDSTEEPAVAASVPADVLGGTPAEAAMNDAPLSNLERIAALYRVVNQEKAGSVPEMLIKYAGKEQKLWKSLRKKYGSRALAQADVDAYEARRAVLADDDARKANEEQEDDSEASYASASDEEEGSGVAVLTSLDRLSAFYEVYNPENLPKVGELLAKYAGKEEKLWKGMAKKYGTASVETVNVALASSDRVAAVRALAQGRATELAAAAAKRASKLAAQEEHTRRVAGSIFDGAELETEDLFTADFQGDDGARDAVLKAARKAKKKKKKKHADLRASPVMGPAPTPRSTTPSLSEILGDSGDDDDGGGDDAATGRSASQSGSVSRRRAGTAGSEVGGARTYGEKDGGDLPREFLTSRSKRDALRVVTYSASCDASRVDEVVVELVDLDADLICVQQLAGATAFLRLSAALSGVGYVGSCAEREVDRTVLATFVRVETLSVASVESSTLAAALIVAREAVRFNPADDATMKECVARGGGVVLSHVLEQRATSMRFVVGNVDTTEACRGSAGAVAACIVDATIRNVASQHSVPCGRALLLGRVSDAPSSGAFAVLAGDLDASHTDHPRGTAWSAGMLNVPMPYRDSRAARLGKVGSPPRVFSTAPRAAGTTALQDHIFVGDDVDVLETLPLPFGTKVDAVSFGALPNDDFPCTHLAVGAVVLLTDHVGID
jgi:hypothetical protein